MTELGPFPPPVYLGTTVEVPFLRRLSAEARGRLSCSLTERIYARDEIVFRPGETAEHLFVVLDGVVQTFGRNDAGEAVLVERRVEGELFGAQALLHGDGGTRRLTAQALLRTRLAVVPVSALEELTADDASMVTMLAKRHRARTLLRRSRLFRLLRHDLLAAGAQVHQHASGSVLQRQGAPPGGVHLVVSGELERLTDERGSQGRVGVGELLGVGEAIAGTSPTQTVRTRSEATTLYLGAERFSRRHRESHEFRKSLDQFGRYADLVLRTLRESAAGDATVVGSSTTHTLADGRTIRSTRSTDGAEFRVQVRPPPGTPEVTTRRLVTQGTPTGLTLALGPAAAEGAEVLIGFQVGSQHDAVEALYWLASEAIPLSQEMLTEVVDTGRLPFAPPPATKGLICRCLLVDAATVRAVVAEGQRSLEGIREITGCGGVCGACRVRLLEVLEEEVWQPAALREVVTLTDRIRAFRFQPLRGVVPRHVAGQHVELRARIDGKWRHRTFALTSPDGADHWELTVRRGAPGGVSDWLFSSGHRGREFALSAPSGGSRWQSSPRPTLCFVAGVGVAPAVSIVRTRALAAEGGHCAVHYSARDHASAAWLDELERTAAAAPWFTLRFHETAKHGRMRITEVDALVQAHPAAEVLVCGPDGYLDLVNGRLKALGVSADRVHLQSFSSPGPSPGAAPQAPLEGPSLASTGPSLPALRPDPGASQGPLQGLGGILERAVPLKLAVGLCGLLATGTLALAGAWGWSPAACFAAMLLLSIATDLRVAHRDWCDCFESLGEQVRIAEGERRPPGFSGGGRHEPEGHPRRGHAPHPLQRLALLQVHAAPGLRAE